MTSTFAAAAANFTSAVSDTVASSWNPTTAGTTTPEGAPLNLTLTVTASGNGNRVQCGNLGRSLTPVEAQVLITEITATLDTYTDNRGPGGLTPTEPRPRPEQKNLQRSREGR